LERRLISLNIRHKTTYRFNKLVTLGPHRLMLRPRESRDLRLISSRVMVAPDAVVTWAHDIFGNSVATANRAFVSIDNMQLVPYPNPPTVRSGWAVVNNGGATMATHAIVHGGCSRAKSDAKIVDPYEGLDWTGGTISKVNVVSAKQNVPLPLCDFTESEFEAAGKSGMQLFIGAIIEYRDIFDPGFRHITEQTMKILTDGITARYAFIGSHNCTDRDCPDYDQR
jgi:hypothetical protein